MSQYDDWLNELEDAGLRDDLPMLYLGTAYSVVWEVQNTHPKLGTISDGTFSMAVADAPGGTNVATGTVASGTVEGGVNPVDIDIAVAAQSGITEPDAPGVVNLFFAILFTPAGGFPVIVRGGILPVLAEVPA